MIYVAYIPRTRLGNWLFQIGAALTTGQEVAFWCLGNEEAARYVTPRLNEILPDLKVVLDVPPETPHWKQPQGDYCPLPSKLQEGNWVLEGLYQNLRYLEPNQMPGKHGGGAE